MSALAEVLPILIAGVPAQNNTLYHRIRFCVGDPAALLEVPKDGGRERILILRDLEMERARKHARVDRVVCPQDFAPASGLSNDRETATAQAAAECLRREGVQAVLADRTLALSFVHELHAAGIAVHYDAELGVRERRSKDEQEIQWLHLAQAVTEGAVRMACELIARATVDAKGTLKAGGAELTSERVKTAIDVWLLERGYENQGSIVAGGPQGADCHHAGSGPLFTGQPIMVDVFPRCRTSRYYGDCTRTVVHGEIPAEIARMHTAVVQAKTAALAVIKAGVTGAAVHAASRAVIEHHGYKLGLPPAQAPHTYCGMVHGTGHGVGLDVHEPPLLDLGGPPLITGDCLTVEPGLYCKVLGGIRVEDMVVVTALGCINLNALPEGLTWT